MNNTLKPVNLFSDISPSTTGQIEITKNSVTWQISLVEGKLYSATHSLQSGQTLKYYLRSIGCEEGAKSDFLNHQTVPNKSLPIKDIVNYLEKRGFINNKQKISLQQKIAEDALESLFWLNQGKDKLIINQPVKPLKNNPDFPREQGNLLELDPLISNVHNRLQTWQKLNPFIVSPHQRPYCVNPSLLDKSHSLGNISLSVLKQLVKLMQGLSIRELAFLIRQDELKLAQLLANYIKHQVLQLYAPKSPFDLLPQIPPPITQESSSRAIVSNQIKTQKPKPAQKKLTIICIDDSRAMLEIVGTYLDTDKYELIPIEEPMQSLSYLFKSNPDLILMDISMPGINGNRLCQILKSSSVFKSVPIILISGEEKILNQDTLKATGAKDFLAKPFSQESLVKMIEKYCQFDLE